MATTRRRARKLLVKKSNGVTSIKAAPKKKKRILKKIGGAVKKSAAAVMTAPLIPFKPAMKKNLEGKGISTKGMKFITLIEKFFNENISKKADKASHYEEIENGYIQDNYLNTIAYEDLNDNDSLAADAIVMVVQETIKFFKSKKDKKAAAKAQGANPSKVMTQDELDAAAAAEKVTKDLEAKAESEKSVSKGNMKNILKYIVIAAFLGLVFWYVSKKL